MFIVENEAGKEVGRYIAFCCALERAYKEAQAKLKEHAATYTVFERGHLQPDYVVQISDGHPEMPNRCLHVWAKVLDRFGGETTVGYFRVDQKSL